MVRVGVLLIQENLFQLVNLTNRVLANVIYCAKINRDKARGKYIKYKGYGDDREPNFRMVL